MKILKFSARQVHLIVLLQSLFTFEKNEKKKYVLCMLKFGFYFHFMLSQVNVMDYDDIGSDELIGRTVIDLEDRWFDQRWQV